MPWLAVAAEAGRIRPITLVAMALLVATAQRCRMVSKVRAVMAGMVVEVALTQHPVQVVQAVVVTPTVRMVELTAHTMVAMVLPVVAEQQI